MEIGFWMDVQIPVSVFAIRSNYFRIGSNRNSNACKGQKHYVSAPRVCVQSLILHPIDDLIVLHVLDAVVVIQVVVVVIVFEAHICVVQGIIRRLHTVIVFGGARSRPIHPELVVTIVILITPAAIVIVVRRDLHRTLPIHVENLNITLHLPVVVEATVLQNDLGVDHAPYYPYPVKNIVTR